MGLLIVVSFFVFEPLGWGERPQSWVVKHPEEVPQKLSKVPFWGMKPQQKPTVLLDGRLVHGDLHRCNLPRQGVV